MADATTIQQRIAANRARRERSRRIRIVAVLAALAVWNGAALFGAAPELVGIAMLGATLTSIGSQVFVNRGDEAYRLYAVRLGAVVGGVLAAIAVGTGVAAAVTGDVISATAWQLQATAALTLVASLFLEPSGGRDE